MSKKKTTPVTQDEFEAELQSVVEVPTEKTVHNPTTPLLGIIKTDTGYSVVKILIDPKTLVTSPAEIISQAENKWEANEQFKINVIKQGIM